MNALQELKVPSLNFGVKPGEFPILNAYITALVTGESTFLKCRAQIVNHLTRKDGSMLNLTEALYAEVVELARFINELVDYIEDNISLLNSEEFQRVQPGLVELSHMQLLVNNYLSDLESHLDKGVNVGNYFQSVRTRFLNHLAFYDNPSWFEDKVVGQIILLLEKLSQASVVLNRQEFLDMEQELDHAVATNKVLEALDQIKAVLQKYAKKYLES